jgi:hypothetical protein
MEKLIKKIVDNLQDKHDNFIGFQSTEENRLKNIGFKKGLEWAIDNIKSYAEQEDFEEENKTKYHVYVNGKFHKDFKTDYEEAINFAQSYPLGNKVEIKKIKL